MLYYVGSIPYDSNYLEHHGVKGMKWGVRNGPPYPLDSSGQLKATKALIDELNTKWDYGAVIKGKKYLDPSEVDWSTYRTTPVKDLARTKCGTCWDFVNYQHAFYKSHGYPDKTYMFVSRLSDEPDDIQTHTFSIVEIGGKKYWTESALYSKRGVHKVKSYKDVVNTIKKPGKDWDIYEFNPDGMDKGLTDQEYFDKATRKLLNTSQKNYKKIT